MPAINSLSTATIPGIALHNVNASSFPLPINNVGNSSAVLIREKRDNNYHTHEMAYSAYAKVKRDTEKNPVNETNDIGMYLELDYPNQTSACLHARRLMMDEMTSLVPSSFTFNHKKRRLIDSEFCQFVYRNPPPSTTPLPTTMCNWGVITGFVNGEMRWCRGEFSTTPTTQSIIASAVP